MEQPTPIDYLVLCFIGIAKYGLVQVTSRKSISNLNHNQ